MIRFFYSLSLLITVSVFSNQKKSQKKKKKKASMYILLNTDG